MGSVEFSGKGSLGVYNFVSFAPPRSVSVDSPADQNVLLSLGFSTDRPFTLVRSLVEPNRGLWWVEDRRGVGLPDLREVEAEPSSEEILSF